IRSILTNMDLTIPVSGGEAALGTWQGIFLWEHRTHSHQRKITVTVQGD
ncbi:MAG: YjbQ family protein, partial [Chromatiales bacterium]|nr:YjbQ family protein [Chromatiales bacterium]